MAASQEGDLVAVRPWSSEDFTLTGTLMYDTDTTP